MPERVVVRQDREFHVEFRAADPEGDDVVTRPVTHLHELTPYGMMLGGLGTCTCIVLHTFAQNHGIDLEAVEITLTYDRTYRQDCVDCEGTERYTEHIRKELRFEGGLDAQDREKLHRIARYCPIYKILKSGIPIETRLVGQEPTPAS